MRAVSDSLKSAEAALSSTSPSARADVEILLAHVLHCERSRLIAYGEEVLTDSQARQLDRLVERRAAGEPVAYLTGSAWFCGRQFIVNECVLIPRPETEHLAQAAIEHLARYEKAVALDVGTGCGAIACTIAAALPHCNVHATERSPEALRVAEENARRLRLSPRAPERSAKREAEGGVVDLELADLLPKHASLRFDAVVANLPYIPTSDLPKPPEPTWFEPREALDGGPDGLREYRRLLKALPPHVNVGGIVLLEAAPPTIARLGELAAAAFPHAKLNVGYDYAGLERYVRALI